MLRQERNFFFVAILIIHLFLASYVIFGIQREHWFDVSFSLETAQKLDTQGFNSISWRSYDVHPPTYYNILAVWQLGNPGFTEYHWAQLLSVVFGLVFLLFVMLFVDHAFSSDHAIFVGSVFAIASTYLHYATEVRMYALVFALSATGFYSVVKGGKRWYLAGLGCVLLLPNVHYLAAIASIGIVFLFIVLNWSAFTKDSFRKFGSEKRWLSAFLLVLLIGIAWALTYALPQHARGAGSWFDSPSAISMPSALFYSLFTVNDMTISSAISWSVFLLFCIGLVFLALKVVREMRKSDAFTDQKRIWIVCALTAMAPITYIVFDIFALKLSGGGGWAQLYHHRFFLSVTWMFAAAYLVWLYDAIMVESERFGKMLKRIVLFFAVFLIMVAMFNEYDVSANHELEHMMGATQCHSPTSEKILIGHESPFSALPYEVYAREHNCDWRNFISTNISVAMSRSAGFDIVNQSNVYWNMTLPNESFYYVESLAKSFPINNRIQELVASDEGIWLIKVGANNE